MSIFAEAKKLIIEGEELAVKDAETILAAARSQAGQKVIGDLIAAVPDADRPVFQAVASIAEGKPAGDVAEVLSLVENAIAAARAEVPPPVAQENPPVTDPTAAPVA